MMNVLIADDELPALDELEFLLRQDPRIGEIHRTSSSTEALRQLGLVRVAAAFLDIHMPGLSGIDLARTLVQFSPAPAVIFVTADEDLALDAFEVAAVDYLLKPVRAERLKMAISRAIAASASTVVPAPPRNLSVAVNVGPATKLISQSEVRYAQAQGDYTRLVTNRGSYLVRVPLSELEEQWREAGFLRVHRSYLVALGAISSAQLVGSPASLVVGGTELPVSRRMVPAVRAALKSFRIRPAR